MTELFKFRYTLNRHTHGACIYYTEIPPSAQIYVKLYRFLMTTNIVSGCCPGAGKEQTSELPVDYLRFSAAYSNCVFIKYRLSIFSFGKL